MLELGDRIRRPHVLFAAGAIGILAAGLECIGEHRIVAEGRAMHAQRLFGHLEDADALDVGTGTAEVLVDQFAIEADGLEDLRAGIGHVGRDAHLRHDLVQTLADGLDVVLDGLVGRQIGAQTGVQLGEGFHREIGMDGLGAEACQQREVMDLAGRAGLDDQSGGGAQAGVDQMLMDGRGCQQRRNRDMASVDPPIGDHQDVVAAFDRIDRIGAQRCKAGLDAFLAPLNRIADVELIALELAVGIAANVADAVHVFGRQDRLADLEAQGRVDVVDVEQVRLGSDEGDKRHHQLLADRVDRRVGDLCKQLFEVVVEGLVLVGQDRQRRVVAH